MLNTIEIVIIALGGQATFLLAVGFLVKSLISKWIQQDTEKFKNQLQKDSNVEIEQLKHALQRTALEHQVRFTKLHERRADVIADLYERLAKLLMNSKNFIYQGGFKDRPNQEQEYRKASELAWAFADFVDTHRIYLPETLCASVDSISDVVRKNVVNVGISNQRDFVTGQPLEAFSGSLLKAVESFEKDIPELRKSLEKEFRAMLEGA